MKSKKSILLAALALFILAAAFAFFYAGRRAKPETKATDGEQPITLIPLTGSVSDSSAEVSGLAWHGNFLILLPHVIFFSVATTALELGLIYSSPMARQDSRRG